eukprot:TRINITY_DN2820_c3_g1_i1.p1 TRINITY_DN2820_c3_g1~~TRINITY_DN2820_c3_g1_i1.p1  ORF type:complete len:213 (+),score=50.86 TRINITY_DN2820_c3_g1_i1:55-639(+)
MNNSRISEFIATPTRLKRTSARISKLNEFASEDLDDGDDDGDDAEEETIAHPASSSSDTSSPSASPSPSTSPRTARKAKEIVAEKKEPVKRERRQKETGREVEEDTKKKGNPDKKGKGKEKGTKEKIDGELDEKKRGMAGSTVYEVEQIIGHKVDKKGNLVYKALWKGYDRRHASYISDVGGCQRLVDEYYSSW